MKSTDIQEALALNPTSSKQKYRLTPKACDLVAKLAKEAGGDGK
jgi:hypothetical protein